MSRQDDNNRDLALLALGLAVFAGISARAKPNDNSQLNSTTIANLLGGQVYVDWIADEFIPGPRAVRSSGVAGHVILADIGPVIGVVATAAAMGSVVRVYLTALAPIPGLAQGIIYRGPLGTLVSSAGIGPSSQEIGISDGTNLILQINPREFTP